MDDSCAVCAESLEWTAYGPCGHREVCSTCVVRLRFICDDRKCCICKTESDKVFVTKAMGDYTRMINDFSVFPIELREGKVGPYWYHEDTQAFFDDVEHYKMIKAMCRLSCSVCDKMDEQSNDASNHRRRFRNMNQLKGHLFHQHGLVMCNLCLEGRKVFVCEQKLYTRVQLNQHISTGDSEVDGSEIGRGGFMGHPRCEFCRTPFYGDNELYTHMSTEHYTCHICQRQHPGQYEYFRNYDDLEIHFCGEHFLCEDEACLAKKFIVFQSEAELKRHNAMEHGGRMSRSQRNAALQLPTSFRYRRNNEQENRRRRGRNFFHEPPDIQLSQAIEASLEVATNNSVPDPTPSSAGRVKSLISQGDPIDIGPIVPAFESLTTTDLEESSRYLEALGGGSRNAHLGELSFPPLSAPSSSLQNVSHAPESLPGNTMAANLQRNLWRRKGSHTVGSGGAWSAASTGSVQPSSNSSQVRLANSVGPATSCNDNNGPAPPSYASTAHIQPRPTTVQGLASTGSSKTGGNIGRIIHSVSAPNLANTKTLEPSVSNFPPVSATQTRKAPSNSQAAAHNLANTKSLEPSVSNFPPVSVTQTRKSPSTSQAALKVEDIRTANKNLVEKIRAAVGDEERYTAIKSISGQYRQGSITTRQYLDYVQQYGLSHLVLDLAKLCPDVQKQKELVDMYNSALQSNSVQENGWANGNVRWKESKGSKKGKGKAVDTVGDSNSNKPRLADSVLASVRELQSSYKPAEEEVEVLTKGGYRSDKGKSKVAIAEQQVNNSYSSRPLTEIGSGLPSSRGGSNQAQGNENAGGKQKKKTFHRVRLGDGSIATLLDSKNYNPDSDPNPDLVDGKKNPNEGLPVRGVWRKGGGQKLFP